MRRRILLSAITALLAVPMYGQVLSDEDTSGSIGLSIGLAADSPLSDYAGRGFGLDMGMHIMQDNGLVLMLDCAADFCKAQHDISTSEGWIYEGENLCYLQAMLCAGRILHESERWRTFPFAGIGVSGFQLAKADDEEHSTPDKTGPALCAGCCFDWHLGISQPTSGTSTAVRHSIRIKPWLGLGYYTAPLRWTPTLNLSVCYSCDL